MKASLRIIPVLGAIAGSVALSGCSGAEAARAFGLERSVPDEYTVTTRAPLSMPPSEELTAPNVNGQATPSLDQSPRMQALETLSPNVALQGVNGQSSAGQSTLVGQARAAAATPDNGELGAPGAGFVDQLMVWKSGSGSVVDGKAENERLKQDSALGRDPTSGVTPTVKAKKSSFLGIF
ncbi:hypothetical protein AA103196_0173 [Ameyamaea chiangmaiensis NBRC 103196]|nr:hypothetical protein AA103196_0173 [Ameyamaea chiangmaiensis NBRC 103196]